MMSTDDQNSAQGPERLSMDLLSADLQRNIKETLGSPVIPLVFDGKPAGSGVLVEIDDVSGILTAEHVVFNPNMPLAKTLGLWTVPLFYSIDTIDSPIGDDRTIRRSSTNIRVDLLRWYPESPHRQDYKDPDAAWGPDLAFIRLPKAKLTNFERELRAVRINFYSWAREPLQRMRRALDEANTVLAVVGLPGEWMKDDPFPREGQMSQILKGGVLVTAQERYWPDMTGFDFIDALAAREPGASVPNSFKGVSAGALWRFRDPFRFDRPISELKAEDWVLAGIAFWEDHTDPNAPFVRGHGPRSLYEKFLPEVRAWLKETKPIVYDT
jgi:hypothetical protein